MYRVRLVQQKDIDKIFRLIKSGTVTMTTMPKTKIDLKKRIKWSNVSARKASKSPNHDSYLFVLEKGNQIHGLSAIYTSVSKKKPSVYFKQQNESYYSKDLKIKNEFHSLQLHFVKTPYTELGTLYIDPKHRGKGGGKLISFARFMYMSISPKRFDRKVFVEIRGHKDKKGSTPFWDQFSSHFFDLDFFDADNISYIDNNFISELIPKYPFPIDLIPLKARQSIGKPHQSSLLAYKLLRDQSFEPNGLVDVLDGGPCISANISNIPFVNTAKSFKIGEIKKFNNPSTKGSFIFKDSLNDFVATRADILEIDKFETSSKSKQAPKMVRISPTCARLLEVNIGDCIKVIL